MSENPVWRESMEIYFAEGHGFAVADGPFWREARRQDHLGKADGGVRRAFGSFQQLDRAPTNRRTVVWE